MDGMRNFTLMDDAVRGFRRGRLGWRGGPTMASRWVQNKFGANPSRSICNSICNSRAPLGYGWATVALRSAS